MKPLVRLHTVLVALLYLIVRVKWAQGCGYKHVKHHYKTAAHTHRTSAERTLQLFGPLWERQGIPIPGVRCSEEGGCSKDRRLLETTTDTPYPIRIATDFQLDNLDADTQKTARTLVNGASRTLQKFLKVKSPVHGNLLVTPACISSSTMKQGGVKTNSWCNKIDPDFSAGSQLACTQVKLNPDHFGSATTCDEQGGNCNTRPAGTGQPVDIYVYVTAKSDASNNCGNDYLAYAQPCYFDLVTNRPLVAAVNICPTTLREVRDPYSMDKQMDVIVHELVHSLGFTNDLFDMYWGSDNKVLPQSKVTQQYPSPFDSSAMVTWVVTPSVAREAQAHYGCDSLPGMPMEDEGGSGVELSHWEFRVTQGELMSPITPMDGSYQQMSRLTLALLEDTGWYVVDYTQAGYLDWGKNGGCAFVTGTCDDYQAKTPKQNWFCSTTDASADCTSMLEATGNCTSSNSLKVLSNGCGMVQAFLGVKNCQVGGSVDKAVSDYQFWAYGPQARCIQVNYPLVTPSSMFPAPGPGVPDMESYCLNFTCQSNQLYVTIFDKTLPCPEGEKIELKNHFKQYSKGSVGPCPSATKICPTLACQASCYIPYGGSCREGKCSCNIGYTGADCTTRYSGLPPLPPAPQSSLPPSSTSLPQNTPTAAALNNAANKAKDFFTDKKNRRYLFIAAGVAGALLLLVIVLWCCRRRSLKRNVTKYSVPSQRNTVQMNASTLPNHGSWSPQHYNYPPPAATAPRPNSVAPTAPLYQGQSPNPYPSPQRYPDPYSGQAAAPYSGQAAKPYGGQPVNYQSGAAAAPYSGQSRAAQPNRLPPIYSTYGN